MRRSLLPFLAVLLLSKVTPVSAQAPGGVPSPEVWFRTYPTGTQLLGTYHWIDLSGDSVALVARNKNKPDLSFPYVLSFADTHSFNFHPALKFSGSGSLKEASLSYSALAQGTVIGVFAPLATTSSSDAFLYGAEGRSGEGFLISKDKIHHAAGLESPDYGSGNGEDLLYGTGERESETEFLERFPRTVSYLWANRPIHSVWGEPTRSVITLGGVHGRYDSRFSTAFADAVMNGAALEGYIPELIVFNRMLTPSERLRVESGLALRYGLTLSGSYLDSRGNLIWDYASNKNYHHRVTGIIRDDGGNLLQPLSTTSYEETPDYTTENGGDTYYQKSPYNLPSSKRTLVLGREYGSPLSPECFLVWGDDGKGTDVQPLASDSLWHLMDRRWLARTNIMEQADTSAVRWFSRDFTITRKGFTDRLVRNNEGTEASAVSAPLLGTEGSIEFVCPVTFPSFDIGYSTLSDGRCNYGFRILTPTMIQVIENGALKEALPVASIVGKRILIRKDNSHIFLSIDGTGSDRLSLNIQGQSATSCKAAMKVNAAGVLDLPEVRLTGTSLSGNMAELGYAQLKDEGQEFFCGRVPLLVIDRTGSGDFTSENIRFVKCSSTDLIRKKLIFHNIFFDDDAGGSDVFTFGYYDGLMASFHPENAHCKNGAALSDGSIRIRVELGIPVYSYRLTASDVPGMQPDSLVSAGVFSGEDHLVGGLRPGLYGMTLSQGGSNDITGSGSTSYTGSTEDTRRFATGTVSWVHPDLSSHVRVGIRNSGQTSKTIRYGFDIRGDKAMIISNAASTLLPPYTLAPGDSLGLVVDSQTVSYRINGKEVMRSNHSIPEWNACVKYGPGTSHITTFKVSGAYVPSFDSNIPVKVRNIGVCSVTREIRVCSDCGSSSEVLAAPGSRGAEAPALQEESSDDRFSATQDGSLTLSARLLTSASEPATLMVFDVSGHLVSEKAFGRGTDRILKESVPVPGVYVVKAVTHSGEHTRKVLIK